MALKLFTRKQVISPRDGSPRRRSDRPDENYEPATAPRLPDDGLDRQLQLERYGFIVANPHLWKNHPQLDAVKQAAASAIADHFLMVPEGFASLPQTLQNEPGSAEVDVETEPYLLARCPVTNAQFQKFVDAGSYEAFELWPRDIWPHLIEFVDRTAQAGPRYWEQGRHDHRLAEHPVVGICYFEAAAYAQWAGYRLPTEAEWQMAASWRLRSSAQCLRRYPWGDALDVQRCNIWASNIGNTVPVQAYESGTAPNGVLQLIGNIWEWTSSDFTVTHEDGWAVVGDMPLKSVRGGAFDTYFAAQATSCFRTGLVTLSRMYNTGFRCALDLNPVYERCD